MPFTDGIKVRTSARSGGGYLLSIIIDMWHRTGLVTVQSFWIGAATPIVLVGWGSLLTIFRVLLVEYLSKN